MQVQVVENVLKLNDEIASMNRKALRDAKVFTVDLIGAPGCGKTALIEATMQRLKGKLRMGVVVGDLATQRDAERMARYCDQVVQINTGRGCHLEANHVKQARAKIDLGRIDLLFIETDGNLLCPVGFDLGQDAKVGLFSVSGGDDKAAKHPFIVVESSVIVLNKTDLLPHIPFDKNLFYGDIKKLNPKVNVLELSATTGQGLDAWTAWLMDGVLAAKTASA